MNTRTTQIAGRRGRTRRLLLPATALMAVTVMAGCGSDDDAADATAAPTAAPTTVAATTVDTEPTATEPAGTAAAGGDPYCVVAVEMDQQEDFPTKEQLTRAQEVAPAEIAAEVSAVTGALIPAAGDMVATFNAFSADDIEAAIEVIDAYEDEVCGTEPDDEPPAGSSTEIEADAARVDVVATDYAFEVSPATLAPGRTSFVLVNHGQEAHFLLVSKLVEGTSMEEALAMEDPSAVIEGEWESGLAAAGGDEEAVTLDLEAGTYALLCFIPAADGTPHAFMGMTKEIVVS